MRDAIINRISRRTYTGEPLSEEEQKMVLEMVYSANEESGLSIELIENGGDAFGSLRKSYGMFKNVRSLLLMKGLRTDPDLKEKIGYYGERIVFELTDLGLGSCWVGATFDKDKFNISDDEEIVCVIVFGKISTVTLKEKMMRAAASKNRKPVEQRIEVSGEIPYWIRNGIEAVRLAPSAMNSQKVTFHYDGNILTVDVSDDYVLDLIDLGIAKYHFEQETGGKFALGNGATYTKE